MVPHPPSVLVVVWAACIAQSTGPLIAFELVNSLLRGGDQGREHRAINMSECSERRAEQQVMNPSNRTIICG